MANNNTPKQNDQDHYYNINTITTGDDRTRLQLEVEQEEKTGEIEEETTNQIF